MNTEKRVYIIKKLLYQSCNRGCKEIDLIVGEFAKQNLIKMNDIELENFSKLLQIPDIDIYNWYIKKTPIPLEYVNSVMLDLLKFNLHR